MTPANLSRQICFTLLLSLSVVNASVVFANSAMDLCCFTEMSDEHVPDSDDQNHAPHCCHAKTHVLAVIDVPASPATRFVNSWNLALNTLPMLQAPAPPVPPPIV